MAGAHQVGARLRELALTELRVTVKECAAGDESEDRIAEEFKLLIVQRLRSRAALWS